MEEKDLIETGTPENTEEKAVTVTQPEPDTEPAPSADQPNILVMGILALALGYQVGIPGIILGIIGRTRGNRFLASGGVFNKSNRIGYTLSKAGFIVGIVSTVIVAVVITLYIAFLVGLFALIASGVLQKVNFNDILMFR